MHKLRYAHICLVFYFKNLDKKGKNSPTHKDKVLAFGKLMKRQNMSLSPILCSAGQNQSELLIYSTKPLHLPLFYKITI